MIRARCYAPRLWRTPPHSGSSSAPTPARFALILHGLWNPYDPRPMLSAARMEDAIELGEFFRAHISRFLALLNASAPTSFAGRATRIERILRTEQQNEDHG